MLWSRTMKGGHESVKKYTDFVVEGARPRGRSIRERERKVVEALRGYEKSEDRK